MTGKRSKKRRQKRDRHKLPRDLFAPLHLLPSSFLLSAVLHSSGINFWAASKEKWGEGRTFNPFDICNKACLLVQVEGERHLMLVPQNFRSSDWNRVYQCWRVANFAPPPWIFLLIKKLLESGSRIKWAGLEVDVFRMLKMLTEMNFNNVLDL